MKIYFYCCDELKSLNINAEIGEIHMKCEVCGSRHIHQFIDKFKMCEVINVYTHKIKNNMMYFEDYTPIKKVKITGMKLNGGLEVVETDVSKLSYYSVMKDVDLIRSLNDTSVILGDDTPTLYLPFEEEGLACSKMIVEIIN